MLWEEKVRKEEEDRKKTLRVVPKKQVNKKD